MVDIIFRKSFRKYFDIRVRQNPILYDRFLDRVKLFAKEPGNPMLRDHPPLMGEMKKNRAFAVTDDIRIIYRIVDDNTVEFFDIGTHEQVYGK